jgi:hypothetical protein
LKDVKMDRGLPHDFFAEEFLIACAVNVKKAKDVFIDFDQAVNYIKVHFDASWLNGTIMSHCDRGWLRGSYTRGEPTRYNLTDTGVAEAEQLAGNRGENLDDLIKTCRQPILVARIKPAGKIYNFPQQADSPVLSIREEDIQATLVLGPLIRLDPTAKQVSEDIKEALEDIREEHFRAATDPSEWSERLAQIEMGRNLLQGEHLYRGMLHFCLLAPLLWILPKITDDDRQAEIQRLIDVTEKLLQN